MYWHRDHRRPIGGYWRCHEKELARQLRYWHRADGGYIRRRQRDLAKQKSETLARLETIQKEEALVSEP